MDPNLNFTNTTFKGLCWRNLTNQRKCARQSFEKRGYPHRLALFSAERLAVNTTTFTEGKEQENSTSSPSVFAQTITQ